MNIKVIITGIGLLSSILGILVVFFPNIFRLDQIKTANFRAPVMNNEELHSFISFLDKHKGEVVWLDTKVCQTGFKFPGKVEIDIGGNKNTEISWVNDDNLSECIGKSLSNLPPLMECGGKIMYIEDGIWDNKSWDCKGSNHAVFFDGYFKVPESKFCGMQWGIEECLIRKATSLDITEMNAKLSL